MASIGHIAVGLAAGRAWRRERPLPAMLWFSGLSLLPDADVIAFALRIPYAHPWGHRGATHSLAFALVVALAAAILARRRSAPAIRAFLFVAVVVGSHGLLDTLTDGGLGCALFWPFDAERYFAPWRPLPVAPVGLGYLSISGLRIALREAIVFLPLLGCALWPRPGQSFRARDPR